MDAKGVRLGPPLLVEDLGDAADRIATHLRLGAVLIIYMHLEALGVVPGVGHHTIAPDAGVAVGVAPGECRIVEGGVAVTIDVDIVVAQGLHRGEVQDLGHCFALVFLL